MDIIIISLPLICIASIIVSIYVWIKQKEYININKREILNGNDDEIKKYNIFTKLSKSNEEINREIIKLNNRITKLENQVNDNTISKGKQIFTGEDFLNEFNKSEVISKKENKENRIYCMFKDLSQGVDLIITGNKTDWYMQKSNKAENTFEIHHIGELVNSQSFYMKYSKMYDTPETGMEPGKKIDIIMPPLYELIKDKTLKLRKKGNIKFI